MARFDTIAVYMMTDLRYGTLYTGVTSDLVHRVSQHRSGFWRGLGIHAQVQLHAACLVRGACGHGCCDPARDVDQTIFACVEDQSDRGGEPRLLDLWDSILPGPLPGQRRTIEEVRPGIPDRGPTEAPHIETQ